MSKNKEPFGITYIAITCILLILSVYFVISKSQPNKETHKAPQKTDVRNSGEPHGLINDHNRLDAQANQSRITTAKPLSRDDKQVVPPMALTASNGSLTSSAIRELDLSKDDVPILQKIISSRLKEIETRLASNAIYLESESDPDGDVFSYQIPALGDKSKPILNSLKSDLLARFQETKGEAIYSAFINDPGNRDKLAGLGQYDTKIKFQPNDSGDSRIVTLVYTDPNTGKRIFSSTRTIESFKEIFGDTFVFDHRDLK